MVPGREHLRIYYGKAMTPAFLYGIDLGGSKIEGVVVRPEAPTTPLLRERIDTEGHAGYEHVCGRIEQLVRRMEQMTGSPCDSLGVAAPGIIDPTTGSITNRNLVCLDGHPLGLDLAARLSAIVRIENDANCFALAEATLGAGRGAKSCIGIILGTGVGGGIIIDGKPVTGAHGIAGEWGHLVLEPDGPMCGCGLRGCLEALISGPALERRYREGGGSARPMPEIYARHQAGTDPEASATIAYLCEVFGRSTANLVKLLDPHVIVVGGGLSHIDELFSVGVNVLHEQVFGKHFKIVVRRHELGDSAGVFGAAVLSQIN